MVNIRPPARRDQGGGEPPMWIVVIILAFVALCGYAFWHATQRVDSAHAAWDKSIDRPKAAKVASSHPTAIPVTVPITVQNNHPDWWVNCIKICSSREIGHYPRVITIGSNLSKDGCLAIKLRTTVKTVMVAAVEGADGYTAALRPTDKLRLCHIDQSDKKVGRDSLVIWSDDPTAPRSS